MEYFLETDRLYLRVFLESDTSFILSLDSDARVMRYVRLPSVTMEDAIATYQKIILTGKKDRRFGNWVAIAKDTNAPIGWFCLKDLDGTQEYEVGYRLLFNEWNKGYATEGTKAILNYGFNSCGLHRITAVTHLENLASHHVLEKCGLQHEKNAVYYGSLLKYYAIELPINGNLNSKS